MLCGITSGWRELFGDIYHSQTAHYQYLSLACLNHYCGFCPVFFAVKINKRYLNMMTPSEAKLCPYKEQKKDSLWESFFLLATRFYEIKAMQI